VKGERWSDFHYWQPRRSVFRRVGIARQIVVDGFHPTKLNTETTTEAAVSNLLQGLRAAQVLGVVGACSAVAADEGGMG